MSAPEPELPFLGRGWAFPPTFSADGGQVQTVEGPAAVAQSIAVLLRTQPGERVARPQVGAGLDTVLFEEVDQQLLSRVRDLVSQALLASEPRVDLDEVDVSPSALSSGVLQVRVTYRLRTDNSRYNLVYPFALQEAATSVGEPVR